ncbi:subclass B3 metallo-beta-lactamase [Blastomonas sp.]|uniref:subclass B3 metallo-beta-lactamase n=1 Tax=Blastomonas sp. TaxID=1909299 RepID=UPI0026251B2F|nr:subclass B3 metallo-beta-lactamase [Blastomonas sp.]MDM7955176.1 subclass B3 metallo-beta-lactamase [Blastomonas sp.]
MNTRLRFLASGLAAALVLSGCTQTAAPGPRLASDAQIETAQSAPVVDETAIAMRWNERLAPFTIIDNVHFVGTHGLGVFLITTPDGHVLIDGALAQSVPQILDNIRALGFDPSDIKYLLNTHAHYDHAAGLAGLQRASGAVMIASAADKPYLEAGRIDHGPTQDAMFPPVRVDRVVGDGDTVALGGAMLTAHLTPGHSPGCTSWSMAAKDSKGLPRSVFLHCSASLGGQSLVPEAYPGMIANYRATFAKVRGMQADVFLANHDIFFDLHAKRARQLAGDRDAFVDALELQRFNTEMEQGFQEALAEQQAAKR